MAPKLKNEAYDIGIHFGPTFISAAHTLRVPRSCSRLVKGRKEIVVSLKRTLSYHAAEDFLVNLGQVEGSLEYRKFYSILQDKQTEQVLTHHDCECSGTSWQPHMPSVSDMRSMFIQELSALIYYLDQHPSRVITQISAASIPEYWPIEVEQALLAAAKDLRIRLKPDLLLSHEQTARLAYNLGEFKKVGSFLLVMINYNASELYLSFAEFSDHEDPNKHPRYPVDGRYTLKSLGENFAGHPNYDTRLREALDIFIDKHTVPDPENINDSNREDLYEFPYKHIKAVLLTGNASASAMEHMRRILRERFADLTIANGMPVVFDTIDPSCVGALGAARAVRAVKENAREIYDVLQPIAL